MVNINKTMSNKPNIEVSQAGKPKKSDKPLMVSPTKLNEVPINLSEFQAFDMRLSIKPNLDAKKPELLLVSSILPCNFPNSDDN